MALSTGWKVGLGIAALGIGAWVVALASKKPPEQTPADKKDDPLTGPDPDPSDPSQEP